MAETLTPEVVESADLEALSHAAAERVSTLVAAAIAERGRCTLALSGGATPLRLYQLLAGEFASRAPWRLVEWFWSDERCVPPDHSESNYRMAHDTLLAPLRVPFDMAHRIACSRDDIAGAARAYDAVLHDRLTAGRFDLVLLGVGTDGHTASLFPRSPALDERDRWAVEALGGPKLALRERVTLTLPVLDRARAVFVLASGADKAPVVARALAGDRSDPIARVRPAELVWFVDRAALGKA